MHKTQQLIIPATTASSRWGAEAVSALPKLPGNRLLTGHSLGLFGPFKVSEVLPSRVYDSKRKGSNEEPGRRADPRAWRHPDR